MIKFFPFQKFFFLVAAFAACRDSSPTIAIQDLQPALSSYQKSVLNNYYQDDFQAMDLELYYHHEGIPLLKDGKATIIGIDGDDSHVYKHFQFKDSLLVSFKPGGQTITVTYDEERNPVEVLAMKAEYDQGKRVSANNGVADWAYEYRDNCTIATVTSRNSDFISTRTFCYDEQNRLISSERRLYGNHPDELRYFQYTPDGLVGKQYFEIMENDTLSFTISTVEEMKDGLIYAYSEENKTEHLHLTNRYENSFSVLQQSPLIIEKLVMVDGELRKEVRLSFNEKGHLAEYFTKGEYGAKYKVKYE